MPSPTLAIRSVSLACTLALLCVASSALGDNRVQFNRDIRPILSDNCFKCHGPDEQERQAGLRLDTEEGTRAALDSGATAVVPQDVEASELVHRITSTDPDVQMPPPDTGKQLTAKQIELLTQWIAEGAEWKGHWSFEPVRRVDVPTVAHQERVVNPIDNFIFARIEAEGLQPSAEADKMTLIRRVTYDLTGLPPTPAEVNAFLADTSPNAYEKVVDRLLQSERYGEAMARIWLDLARYGDTHGLHFDNERALWKYREWVISSFNRNQPFDQFAVEQIAGDLLPQPTLDQQIATGFNRCNVSTSEGGSIDAEVLVRYAVDRTSTVGTVFMGLTLGCAVCHDHKFDPITQKEFYKLYAFYNSAADAAMDGNQLAPPPIIKVPSHENLDRIRQIDEKIAAIRSDLDSQLVKLEYTDPQPMAAASVEPFEYVWIEDDPPAGAQLQGDSSWEFVTRPDHPVFSGEKATRRQADALSQHFFTGATSTLRIGENDKLFAYVYLDPQNPPKTVMLQFNDGVWEHRAFWGEDLIPFGGGGKENHLSMGALPASGEWVRLEVDAAAVGLKPGAMLNGWAFTQYGGLAYWDKAGIVTRTPQTGTGFESLAEWDAYERSQTQSSVPAPVREALLVAPEQRTDEHKQRIRNYFLAYIYPKTRVAFEPLQQQIAALEKEKQDVDASIPVTMVMADLPQPRDTFVLVRGQYDKPGEKVEAGVPAVFPQLPEGMPSNRLGLAKWLVDPSHPLTARVTINRFWQRYFGRGIVKTSEDFGVQGEWPTHPELLDWLAIDFIDHGWDVKRMQKMIVMSSTYRQSSNVTAEQLKRDPENVLLSRGPRFRLDAEVVRDSALFVSGLLVEKVGGPSVRPYQPSGVWEAVGFVGSNTTEFKRDSGEKLYRRSLYTFWKRTAPPPSLMAFDAPSRENCVARRARTNTPLQALVLMNDEQYVEAARHLAARVLKEGGTSPVERLNFAFQLATARTPDASELETLTTLYQQNLAHYDAHPDAANQLLAVGESARDQSLSLPEHAAMTMMANLILNLDEVITKE